MWLLSLLFCIHLDFGFATFSTVCGFLRSAPAYGFRLAFSSFFLARSCLGFLLRPSTSSHPRCRCLRSCLYSAVVIAHGSSLFTASHPFFHLSLLPRRGSAPYLLLSNGPFSSSLFSASLLSRFSVASSGRSVATNFGASVSLARLWRLPMFLNSTGTSSIVRCFFAWTRLLLSHDLLRSYVVFAHIVSTSTHSAVSRKKALLQLRVFPRISLYTVWGRLPV